MRKVILQFVKATFPLLVVFSTLITYGQQYVIADKDNTHPEQTRYDGMMARVTQFTVTALDGYYEIHWSAFNEQDTRSYIVEYTLDGINYSTAGEVTASRGNYSLQHYTSLLPLAYRIRMERKDGKFFSLSAFPMEGTGFLPVKVYPTIVTGNVVNLRMDLPVQRIRVTAENGQQVWAKDMGGFTGTTRLLLPASLNEGMYWVTFYGDFWKNTQKIMIGR